MLHSAVCSALGRSLPSTLRLSRPRRNQGASLQPTEPIRGCPWVTGIKQAMPSRRQRCPGARQRASANTEPPSCSQVEESVGMAPAGKGRERKRGRPGQGTAARESGRLAPRPGGLRRLRVRVTLAACPSTSRFSTSKHTPFRVSLAKVGCLRARPRAAAAQPLLRQPESGWEPCWGSQLGVCGACLFCTGLKNQGG